MDERRAAAHRGHVARSRLGADRPGTSGRLANEEYITAFYENAVETLSWLRVRGVEIVRTPTALPVTFARYARYVVGGGRAIVDALAPALSDLGAMIFYETVAVRLRTDNDGAVTGVVVRAADGVQHVMSADAVVLACGGFEANDEMLERYIPNSHRPNVVSHGTLANRGDGIRMAVESVPDRGGPVRSRSSRARGPTLDQSGGPRALLDLRHPGERRR